MSEGESIYDDRTNISERAQDAKFGLEQLIFGKRGVLKEGLQGKKRVLDLGCGKGAVGVALKQLSPEIEEIVGVDIKRYSSEALQLYSEVHIMEAADFLRKAAQQGRKFDLIMAWGLPPESVMQVVEEIGKDPRSLLSSGGMAALVCEPIFRESEEEAISNFGFSVKEASTGTHAIVFLKNE